MRVLVVEDGPCMAEAIRDGSRWEAIAVDVAADGRAALELLDLDPHDIAVLDRDVPGPSGDDIAAGIVASGSGTPILMLTAADRLDDKASGPGLGLPVPGTTGRTPASTSRARPTRAPVERQSGDDAGTRPVAVPCQARMMHTRAADS